MSAAGPIESRAVAWELFERFRTDGPYYDADEDGRQRTEYYRGIDWDAAPAALAAALTRRLTAGHNGSISYRDARHNFLYPSVDRHEDGLLRNIYSGIPFDPVEAIARELAHLQPLTESLGVDMAGAGFEALIGNDACGTISKPGSRPSSTASTSSARTGSKGTRR